MRRVVIPVAALAALAAGAGCGRVDFDDTIASNAACDAADPDLVGCWSFDDTTRDASQYQNDATSTGATFGPGHDGQAVIIGPQTQLLIAEAPSLDVTDTYDTSATLDVVLDGVVDRSMLAGEAITTTGSAGSRIGGDAGTVAQPPFDGSIDDVRVWRVARSDAELQ